MKSFLIRRSVHDQKIRELRELLQELRGQVSVLRGRCRDYEETNALLESRLDDIIPKLTRIIANKVDVEGAPHYRVCVDIDEMKVRKCFIHGNDQFLIKHICNSVARRLEREFFTINFERLKR